MEYVYIDELVIGKENNKSESIKVNYVPGNISILESDYQKLISEDTINISLIVRQIELCKKKSKFTLYEIDDFKLSWLTKGSYFILYIYNTNNKKYKNIYDSLPNKEFTFEYDWNGGSSMRRVQKKMTKQQKKCKRLRDAY